MRIKFKTCHSRSLEKDVFTAADTLLGWRDSLIEAGWDGQASATDTPRLGWEVVAVEINHLEIASMAQVWAYTGSQEQAEMAVREDSDPSKPARPAP